MCNPTPRRTLMERILAACEETARSNRQIEAQLKLMNASNTASGVTVSPAPIEKEFRKDANDYYMRKAFEHYMGNEAPEVERQHLSFGVYADGKYVLPGIEGRWEAFKAGTKLFKMGE